MCVLGFWLGLDDHHPCSLSENESLFTLPPWTNPYLLYAITLSMSLHFMILYVPFFTKLFAITSLTWPEWQGVIWISLPIIVLDELLKWVSRAYVMPMRARAALEAGAADLTAATTPKTSSKAKKANSASDALSSPRRRRSNADSPTRKSKRA